MATESRPPRLDVYGCQRYSVPPTAALSTEGLRGVASAWGFALHAYLALASLVMPAALAASLSESPAGPQRRERRPRR